MNRRIYKLKNTIMEYPWGDTEFIPGLIGKENPEKIPCAELWMGMHPRGESLVITEEGEVPLSKMVAKQPAEVLGKRTACRFTEKLPFLFKILSAAKPLSIQVHPNLEQAAEGFARENREGIALDHPERNYKDANHKPELIYALTPFWALRGFRSIDEIIVDFLEGNIFSASIYLDDLKRNPGSEGLKKFFKGLLYMDNAEKSTLLNEIVSASVGRDEDHFKWVRKLSKEYPADIGIISPLLLNCIRMAPGEAMFLEAGEPHAYLGGSGIEIMANSDNVLRGGLTGKHIDVPELIRTLKFNSGPVSLFPPVKASPFEFVFDPPAGEFSLSVITHLNGETSRFGMERNIEVLLCTDGEFSLKPQGGEETLLSKGESLLVWASAPQYELKGSGTIFKATV